MGSEDGWKLLAADFDPDAAEQAAQDDLEPWVVAISGYWCKQWRERAAAPRQVRPNTC